jgi:outer membrane protein TolC
MRRFIVFISCIYFSVFQLAGQQDTVSLWQCLIASQKNAVINPQFQVIEDITDLKIANANATNLPSLSAYGKAWYQSDAITVPAMNGPGLEIDRFQYNAGLETDQKLFDGGMAKRSKELELANREAELGRIESEKYQLNNQVSDLFFQIILLEKSLEILELKEALIRERISDLQSAYDNGIIKRNDLEKMQAEQLLLKQQMIEVRKLHEQAITSMGTITSLNLSADSKLVISDSIFIIGETLRPELKYFDAEAHKIENKAHLQKALNLPKLYAYGQAGYMYPGLNFFENQSDYYYIVGAKLSWTIFDWKQTGRETEIIRKQTQVIDTQRDDFNQKLSMALDKENIAQEKLREMIILDADIIRQREAITRGSANALENGVITSADYLEDLNAEIKARLDGESHTIQLQSSMVREKLLKGIDYTTLK